ncbi:actin cytoskeleton-regulatory complex protein pan1 [Diachasma alloeum]|uniref:actin cytoskeleton-regulatory complex protein pan1 n=1 Tax=Diachasma alloeum TaxID=454923 RepID=UPI000738113D|nr:actin cytoskeleton-regulatory complex protein pan1 [Diachasma alloeum]
MADKDANKPAPAFAEDNDGLRAPPLPRSPPRGQPPPPPPMDQENPVPHHHPDRDVLLQHVEQLGRQLADLQRQVRLERGNAAQPAQDPLEPAPRGRGRGVARGRRRAGRFLGERNARYWKGRYYQNRTSRGGGGASFNFFYRD